jgi:hypothetical protein
VADDPAANPMQRLKIELLRAFDQHKSHGRSGTASAMASASR